MTPHRHLSTASRRPYRRETPALQTRRSESRRNGDIRIGMQRISIAAQAVQERLIRAGRKFQHDIRRARRRRVGRGLLYGSAETPILACEGGTNDGGDQYAADRIKQDGLAFDHSALLN